MATLYANSEGNWNAAIWYDVATGQPYADTYPQIGDYVYLNGKNVTYNAPIDIGNGTITNVGNDGLGIVAGGSITNSGSGVSVTFSVVANLIGGSAILFNRSGNIGRFDVTGNITIGSNYIMKCGSYCTGVSINGNIDSAGTNGSITNYINTNTSGHYPDVTINGNVSLSNGCTILNTNPSSVSTRFTHITINGNVACNGSVLSVQQIASNDNPTNTIITGNVKTNRQLFSQRIYPAINIGGDFEGDGDYNLCGVQTTSLTIGGKVKLYDGYHLFFNNGISIGNSNDGTQIRYTGNGAYLIYTSAGMMTTFEPYTIVCEDEQSNDYPYILVAKGQFADYPAPANVRKDIPYAWGALVGTMESGAQVGCVTKEDVREGVSLIGMGEVGTLVVPSVDDVREGVVFDNGSVGTLIVQGGGERLRIADFGYYTRSTSITYIVDLTESDKPAFADCEEIVLRSLFPTLDLDNIPDKFFDDLFVQFLRYRLLVEYYRGTSINSKFTPSEPTAEIVNYANTKCEYWLNTANLFLQLWGEKYPNSVKRDRILL